MRNKKDQKKRKKERKVACIRRPLFFLLKSIASIGGNVMTIVTVSWQKTSSHIYCPRYLGMIKSVCTHHLAC